MQITFAGRFFTRLGAGLPGPFALDSGSGGRCIVEVPIRIQEETISAIIFLIALSALWFPLSIAWGVIKFFFSLVVNTIGAFDAYDVSSALALGLVGAVVSGEDRGSKYLGVALKGQELFQSTIQEGGNAYIPTVKEGTPPLMPPADISAPAATASRSVEEKETKVCPKCAETIKVQAVVCRFCRYNFETDTLETR